MNHRIQFLAAAITAFAAPLAFAFPPAGVPETTNPGTLFGTGADSTAIFTYASAADESELLLMSFGGNPIFNNSTDSIGTTKDLGDLTGSQVFELDNLSTGTDFLANVADLDGNYHAYYTTNYADFGVGALDPTVASDIAGLPAGTQVTFVGWEDLTAEQGSDFDYNDLIFAFTNLTSSSVPEPATLMLFGAGLLGLGWAARRRKQDAENV